MYRTLLYWHLKTAGVHFERSFFLVLFLRQDSSRNLCDVLHWDTDREVTRDQCWQKVTYRTAKPGSPLWEPFSIFCEETEGSRLTGLLSDCKNILFGKLRADYWLPDDGDFLSPIEFPPNKSSTNGKTSLKQLILPFEGFQFRYSGWSDNLFKVKSKHRAE